MIVQGKLIVLEGPDGVGKTTVSHKLYHALMQSGIPCELVAFPGNESHTLGRLVYGLHHSPGRYDVAEISPLSMQLLHVAAHVDAISTRIIPDLNAGKLVLLDRFWWSTWVYGLVGGLDRRVLRAMLRTEWLVWGQVIPASVILLERELPYNDNSSTRQHRKLARQYQILAKREHQRTPVTVIPNDNHLDVTISRAMDVVRHSLHG